MGYVVVALEESCMESGAVDWWKSLGPGRRAVFIQALWECETASTSETEDDLGADLIDEHRRAKERLANTWTPSKEFDRQ